MSKTERLPDPAESRHPGIDQDLDSGQARVTGFATGSGKNRLSRRRFLAMTATAFGAAAASSLLEPETAFAVTPTPVPEKKKLKPPPRTPTPARPPATPIPKAEAAGKGKLATADTGKEKNPKKVPYFSQFKEKNFTYSMGCGPMSLAMILAYKGAIESTYSAAYNLAKKAKDLGLWSPEGGTSEASMVKLAKKYGFGKSYYKNWATLEEIEALLKKDGPILSGYHVDDNIGKIGHIIVVIAVDRKNGVVIINDSARTKGDGEYRRVPIATFEKVRKTTDKIVGKKGGGQYGSIVVIRK